MRERLTATEARLAAMVAGGRSDGEIAVALLLAPNSVESALLEVLRKLEVRSRTELAVLLGDAMSIRETEVSHDG